MEVLGFGLSVFGVIAFVFYLIKAVFGQIKTASGLLGAKAEYARVKREDPDSPSAKISEAEYLQNYVKSRPGFFSTILRAFVFGFFGIIGGCVLQVAAH
jgi:hypothetical protein